MAVQFSNRTLLSTTDQNNHRYWAEFEYKPVKEGGSMYVFKGRLNGDGPRSGEYCAVKMFRKFVAEPSDWNQYVAKSNMANILAEKFNNKLKGQYKVQFLIPILAHLDTVSTCTGCLYWCSDIKAIDTDDCVVIEPYLRHGFRKFYRNSPLKGAENAYILQAFSHFTACETRDTLVCGLQGVAHENEFKLTNPIIHSSDKQWGSTDKGRSGIKNFFRTHSCNRICKTLNLPFLLETNEIGDSVSTINNGEDEEAVDDDDDDVKNSGETKKMKMRDAKVGTDSDNIGEETLVKEVAETTKRDNESDDNDEEEKQDQEDDGKEDQKAVGEKLQENSEDTERKEEEIDVNVEKKPGEIAGKSNEKKAENKIDKSVETEPINNVENLPDFVAENKSVTNEKNIPVVSEGVQATVNAQDEPSVSPKITTGMFVEQGPLLRLESEPGIYLEKGPSVSAADGIDKSMEVDTDESLVMNKVDESVQKNLESIGSVTDLDAGGDSESTYVAGTPLKVIRARAVAASTPSNEITVISGSFDESFKGSPTSDGHDHPYSSDSSVDEIGYNNLNADKKPSEHTEIGGETSVYGKHHLVPNYEDEENDDIGMDSGPPHHRDEIYLPPKILQTPPSNRTGRIFVVPVCRQTGSVRSATSSASVTPPVFLETVSPICRCPASFQPIANSDDVGIGVGSSPSSRTSPLPPPSPPSMKEMKTDRWSEQDSNLDPSATAKDRPNPPSSLFSSTPTPVEPSPLLSPLPAESPPLLSPPPAELPPLPPTPHPTASTKNIITTPSPPSTTSALPRCLRQLTSCCSMRMSKKKKKKKEKDESPESATNPVTLSQTPMTEVPVEISSSKSSGKKRSRSWRTAWRSSKTCSSPDTEASSPKKPAMVSIEMSAPEESDSTVCPKNPFQMVTDGHDEDNHNNNNNDDDYYVNAYINNNNNNINNNDISGFAGSENQCYINNNNNSNQNHSHQMILQKAFVERGQRFNSPPPLLLDSGQPESSTYWEYHCMNPDERGAAGGSSCRCCGGFGGSCSCCGSGGEGDFTRMVSDSKIPPQLETSMNGSGISMKTADNDTGTGDQSHHEYDTLPRRTFDMGFEPNRGGTCETLPCRGDLFTVEVHYNGEAVQEYRVDPAAVMPTITTAVITPPRTVATTAMPLSSSLTEIIEMVPKDSIADVDSRLPVDGYPLQMHDIDSGTGQTVSGSETTDVMTAGGVGSVGVALRAGENEGREEEEEVEEAEESVISPSLRSVSQTAGAAAAAEAVAETRGLTLTDRTPSSSQSPLLKSSVNTLNSRTPDSEGTTAVLSGSVQTGTDNTSNGASMASVQPMTVKCYDDAASSLASTPASSSLSSSSSSSTLLLLPGRRTLQKARTEVIEKISTSTDDHTSQCPRSDIPDIPLLLSEDVDDDSDSGGGSGGDGKTDAAGDTEDASDIPYIDECDSDDSLQRRQQQQHEQDEQGSDKVQIDSYVLDHRVRKHQQQSLAVPSNDICSEDQQHQRSLEAYFNDTYGQEQPQNQQSLEVPSSDIYSEQQQPKVPVDICRQEKQQQYEVPVHMFGQEQHELPVSDTYGQQQQCQPSEIPFSGIHGHNQQQQLEVPSNDIYSQQQTEVPSSDVYSQQQIEVPSNDIYSQQQTEVPSGDIYSQQQTEVPFSDTYSQQQTEVPSSDIYSQQQIVVPSGEIYNQQQTEVHSSDTYSQQQTEVPSGDIYSQQQPKVPSSDACNQQQTDVYGQQLHDQQSVVPSSDIYGQQQQTEVPSSEIYSQQQTELPSTDLYERKLHYEQSEVPSSNIYSQEQQQQTEVPSTNIYGQQQQYQQFEVPSTNIYDQQQQYPSMVPSNDTYDQEQHQQFVVPSTDIYGQQECQQSEVPSSEIHSQQQQYQQTEVPSSNIYNQQHQQSEVPSTGIYGQHQQFEVPSTDTYDQQQHQQIEGSSRNIYSQQQQLEVPSSEIYGQQQYQQTERSSTDMYDQQKYHPSGVPSSDIYSQQQHQQFEVPSVDVYSQQQYQQSEVPSSDIHHQQKQSVLSSSDIYSQQQQHQQAEVPSSNIYSQQQQFEVPSTDICSQQQYQQTEGSSTDKYDQQQYQTPEVPSGGMYSQQQQHQQFEVPSIDVYGQQQNQQSEVPSSDKYPQQRSEVASSDIYSQQQQIEVPSSKIYSQQQYQQFEVPSSDNYPQQRSEVASSDIYSQQQQTEVPSSKIYTQQQYQQSEVPSSDIYGQQHQKEQTCDESKPDMTQVPTGVSCVRSSRNTKHVSFDIPSDQYNFNIEHESPAEPSDQHSYDIQHELSEVPSDQYGTDIQCVPSQVLDDTNGVSSEQFVEVPNRNDGSSVTVNEQVPTEISCKRSRYENEQPLSDSQMGVNMYGSTSQQVAFEGLPGSKSFETQQQFYEVPVNTNKDVNDSQDNENLGRNYVDTQISDCSKAHLLPSTNGNYKTKELVEGGKRLEDDKASRDSIHNISKVDSETFLPELSDISSKNNSNYETVISEQSLGGNLSDHFDLRMDNNDGGDAAGFTEYSTSSTAFDFPGFSTDGFVNAGLNARDTTLSANVFSSGTPSARDSQNLFDSDFQGQRSVESLVEDILDQDSSGTAGSRNATTGVTKTVCFQEDSKIRYDDGESETLEVRHPFLEVIPEEGENIYEDVCVISEEDLEDKPRYSKPLLPELRTETPKLDKHCFPYGDSTGSSAGLYEEIKLPSYSDQSPKKSIDDIVGGTDAVDIATDAAILPNAATEPSVLPAVTSLEQTAVQDPEWDSPEQAVDRFSVNPGGTMLKPSLSCSTGYRIPTKQQPVWSLLSQPTPSPVAPSFSCHVLEGTGTTAGMCDDGHDATSGSSGLSHQASPITAASEYTPQPPSATPDLQSDISIKADKPPSDRRLTGPYIETERSIEIKFRINPAPSNIPDVGGGGHGIGSGRGSGDRSALVTGVGGSGGSIGSRNVGGVYLQPNLEIEECNEIISVCEVNQHPQGLAGTNNYGRGDNRHSRNSSSSSYGRGGSNNNNNNVVNEDEANRQRQCLEALIRESSSRRLSTQEALQTLLAPHWLPHT